MISTDGTTVAADRGKNAMAIPLQLSSISFAVLWTGSMLWSSGSFDRLNVAMVAIWGTLGGYVWYHAMRWIFQCTGLLARHDHSVDLVARP